MRYAFLRTQIGELTPRTVSQIALTFTLVYALFLTPAIAALEIGRLTLVAAYIGPQLIFGIFLTSLAVSDIRNYRIATFLPAVVAFVAATALWGLALGNNTSDVVTSVLFFLGPILAYYFVKSIVTTAQDIRFAVRALVVLTILQIMIFAVMKLISVEVLGRPAVVYKAYNVEGLQSSLLIVSTVLLWGKRHKWQIEGWLKCLIVLLIINEALVPVVLPFKQLLFLFLIWALLISWKFRSVILLSMIICAVLLVLIMYRDELYVVWRLLNYIGDLQAISIYSDKRIAEIVGTVKTLAIGSPTQWILGHGAGGTWNPQLVNIPEVFTKAIDFRAPDRVYMVHSSYFTLLLRSGVLGLLVYAIFLGNIIGVARKLSKQAVVETNSTLMASYREAFLLYLLLMLVASAIDWFIYSNTMFGVYAALATADYSPQQPGSKHP